MSINPPAEIVTFSLCFHNSTGFRKEPLFSHFSLTFGEAPFYFVRAHEAAALLPMAHPCFTFQSPPDFSNENEPCCFAYLLLSTQITYASPCRARVIWLCPTNIGGESRARARLARACLLFCALHSQQLHMRAARLSAAYCASFQPCKHTFQCRTCPASSSAASCYARLLAMRTTPV